ncbi:MAG: IS5 family transposase [Bacteroidetes bacterium]|nr:MAG: IS5 family transposase [Bacteroidota bacterium]
MIRYHSNRQLRFDFFESPFSGQLDATNRWVKLAESLPWDGLCEVYHRSLSQGRGAPSKPARQVVGSLIIRHKLRLSDREVIAQIQANPYLQYFVGLEKYQHKAIFDPSLFVTIRKRVGVDSFEQMNEALLIEAGMIDGKSAPASDSEGESEQDQEDSDSESDSEPEQVQESSKPTHKGKLFIDAMVCEQMIAYPTDLGLVNRSREEAERLIDLIYEPVLGQSKPRTYRRKARKDYLATGKKRNKSKKELRKAIGKQLNDLRRELKILRELLEADPSRLRCLSFRDLKIYWVIQHIYDQQRGMHTSRSNRCEDRIVSIYQPWVRPMVTGKAAKKTEFGAKSSVSLIEGFASVHAIDWNNFHEGYHLQSQVEAYKERHGYYPEALIADQKYGTRDNRRWLKQQGIRFSGKALGRPKTNPSPEDLQLLKLKKKEQRLRSQIEGKFGQGKNGYNFRTIRARLSSTSQSWIAAIFFVMNINKFEQLRACFLAYAQQIWANRPQIRRPRWIASMAKAHILIEQLIHGVLGRSKAKYQIVPT